MVGTRARSKLVPTPDFRDLECFVRAQQAVYSEVLDELRCGRKESHWMWFIFPQLRGLGQSAMTQRYGITSRLEAEAHLAHPILGARLIECTGLVNAVDDASIEEILGDIDGVKFRSSMTLFDAVSKAGNVFEVALAKYYAGRKDRVTLDMLSAAAEHS